MSSGQTPKNFGETPAYKLTNWVTIDIRNTSSPPFDEQAKAGVETIIGPSGATASPKGFEALGDYISAVEEAPGGELLEGTLVTC